MLAARYRGTPIGGGGFSTGQENPGKRDIIKSVFQSHFLRGGSHDAAKMTDGLVHRVSMVPIAITCGAECHVEEQKHCDDDSLDELRMCLALLESGLFEDNRYGMERLMKLVNSELVNSKRIGSVAHALVCGDSGILETERLRNVFLAYFCESNICHECQDTDTDSDDSTSTCSGLAEYAGRHLGALKLPALRILASALDLVVMMEKTEENLVDLSSIFWIRLLGSMAEMTEVVHSRRIEATLSIKCIRLLRSMQPNTIDPYVRYSLLPFVLHAHGFGTTRGDRMLVREAAKLLKPLGISV